MKRKPTHAVLSWAATFLVFSTLMSFVVTCCFFLFIRVMTDSMGVTLAKAHIELAAKLTFVNVLFLSLLFSVIDLVRRHYTVSVPVKRILDVTNAITAGDFTARLPQGRRKDVYGFWQINGNINRMAQELSGTETLRTDFISNVSHELKTPLAVIQNYGTMLQQPGLEEQTRIAYAKTVSSAARRLASLVTNILKLNKLENQQIFPAVQTYDLGEQLCECLLSFEDEWERKKLQIETDICDGIQVSADPEMMSLVWNNLFSNAIKFTEPGGTVGLSLHLEQGRAAVRVWDTGCGIPPEVGRRIFDKFYQGDTSHASQGNGLGLALVKRVVDITGSEISVESQVGRGSTFTVRLREVQGTETPAGQTQIQRIGG